VVWNLEFSHYTHQYFDESGLPSLASDHKMSQESIVVSRKRSVCLADRSEVCIWEGTFSIISTLTPRMECHVYEGYC
jgi:hypothetical protein